MLYSFMKAQMYNAPSGVLKASAVRWWWHLVSLEPPRKRYTLLLYYQNSNNLVLFECLPCTAVQREITQENLMFSGTPALSIIVAHTEGCCNLFTCTSFTIGLQPAAGVHPSSSYEPQTRFSGSLQKYQLVVSVGFSSRGLLLSAYFQIF